MQHQVINSKEPIRLFKSDLLESLTHIKPVTVLAVWLPISLLLIIWGALRVPRVAFGVILLALVSGLFFWTLTEYLLHRFLFHANPRSAWAKRMVYLLHGIHHAQPMVKTRLVMVLPVSIPLAFGFYALFYLVFAVILRSPGWVNPFMGGFLLGYLAYDLIHYALHHYKSSWSAFQYLRRTHLHHHTGIPVRSFGVSSPLWDYVFKTMPITDK